MNFEGKSRELLMRQHRRLQERFEAAKKDSDPAYDRVDRIKAVHGGLIDELRRPDLEPSELAWLEIQEILVRQALSEAQTVAFEASLRSGQP